MYYNICYYLLAYVYIPWIHGRMDTSQQEKKNINT